MSMAVYVSSLFSGAIDGLLQGFMMDDSNFYIPYVSNELDHLAVKTAELNFQHKIINDDVRNVSIKEFMSSNVMLGTFPCNLYTLAAHIHKKGQKENFTQMYHKAIVQDLFLYMFRSVALGLPEVYIWENSPEIRNYPIIMESFKELPPYLYNEVVLDTQDFNLPQRRKRLFVIGTRRPFDIPDPHQFQIYDKQLTIGDIREENPEIIIPNYVKKRIDGGYRDMPSIKTDDDISNTFCAHYARDMGTTMIHDPRGYKGLRSYTVREAARIQGIQDSFKFANARSTNFKHIGNSVSPVVAHALGQIIKLYFKKYSNKFH